MRPSSYTVHYGFTQKFGVGAREAFDWCLDYRPDDWARMGKVGTRKISRLNEDTIVLTDTVTGRQGTVTKRRLVRIEPGSLGWTNTHLDGPNKHSQFWYRIVPEGKGGSRLEFTGLQVNYGRRPSGAKVAEIAEELKADDSGMWALLAAAMKKDLRKG